MTSRERLLCVLGGEMPDRAPISPFVQEEYLSCYFDKKDTDRLTDAIALAEELRFDLIAKQNIATTPYFMTTCAVNWDVDVKTEIKAGNYYKTTIIKTPGGTLKQVEGAPNNNKILSGIHLSTIKYLIECEDDFILFQKYLPPMNDKTKRQIVDSGRFAKKAIGQLGVTAPWAIGGVYNLASTYMNVQNMMVEALIEEEYYREYMNLFSKLTAENYQLYAESAFDCVGIQGNIANGAMFGEALFNEHVLPYERRALDVLIDAGKPTIYHNCGNAKNLYSCYRALGITVWETVAAPPQGDNDLQTAKAYFDGKLILCGNFDQVNFLKTATPAEVEDRAAQQMAVGKIGGHYIFSTSDYLEIDTPLENVKAMLRGAKAYASY